MSQIRRCRFCGGIARLRPVTEFGKRMVYVCCSGCGSMSQGEQWDVVTGNADYIPKIDAIKAAIKDWNHKMGEIQNEKEQ